MKFNKITAVGGDERIKIAKKLLSDMGFTVGTVGLYENDSAGLSDGDVILLPVPTTKDGKTVFAPFSEHKIYLDEIALKANERPILTCNYTFKNKNCTDYGKLDSYALLNAVPTAEGAIELAIKHTPFTLWQSRVLVIGFGRVGKVLADRLHALGAYVTVSARKPSDLALIGISGCNAIKTSDVLENIKKQDIVFNTVDAKVISNEALKSCSDKLIIDLSSSGGFDIEAAKKHRVSAFKASGLPGICAPYTAGKILAETVAELLN